MNSQLIHTNGNSNRLGTMGIRGLITLSLCGSVLLAAPGQAHTVPSPWDLSQTYQSLTQERAVQLDRLHTYALGGRYPQNTNHPGRRMPYFVDRYGAACAVGHLMQRSGLENAVAAIAAANNHVRVMDVHDGPLTEWVRVSGLLQEEAALIQPTYGFRPPRPTPPPPPTIVSNEQERARIRNHLLSVETRLRAQSEQSLGEALRRSVDHAIDVKSLTAKDAPILLKTLNHEEASVRIGAAFAIAKLGIRAEKELTVLLSDPDSDVRLWAAAALVDILPWPRDPKPYRSALTTLSKLFESGDDTRRLFAVHRLGLLARTAQTAPGQRKVLTEIRSALNAALRAPSRDVKLLAECMTGVAQERTESDYLQQEGNAGRVFLELYDGNSAHAAVFATGPRTGSTFFSASDAMARNRFGETPLHVAGRFPNTRLEEYLRLGPDAAAITRDGRIPLHGAMRLEVGGDVNAKDHIYGWTPLHYAADMSRDPDLIAGLLKLGADPNIKDQFGFTPLHIAVGCESAETEPAWFGRGHVEVVKALVTGGGKPDAKDAKSHTPKWWAEQAGHQRVVDYLQPLASAKPLLKGE